MILYVTSQLVFIIVVVYFVTFGYTLLLRTHFELDGTSSAGWGPDA
jgi:hypothetical protein